MEPFPAAMMEPSKRAKFQGLVINLQSRRGGFILGLTVLINLLLLQSSYLCPGTISFIIFNRVVLLKANALEAEVWFLSVTVKLRKAKFSTSQSKPNYVKKASKQSVITLDYRYSHTWRDISPLFLASFALDNLWWPNAFIHMKKKDALNLSRK